VARELGLSKAARIIAGATVIILVAVFAIAAPLLTIAHAQAFTVDSAASEGLTNYLRQNRLPLVGAQIGTASAGARRLVLYGYVATEIGKSDAETKSVTYLGPPRPEIVNHIVIAPEIAKMKSKAPGNSPTGGASDYTGAGGGASFPGESLDQVLQDIQQYGSKSVPDAGP
jgi:hypothetical protein